MSMVGVLVPGVGGARAVPCPGSFDTPRFRGATQDEEYFCMGFSRRTCKEPLILSSPPHPGAGVSKDAGAADKPRRYRISVRLSLAMRARPASGVSSPRITA